MLVKPNEDEYPEYYRTYIDQMPESNILKYYETQTHEVVNLYKSLSEEKLLFRYEIGKWSIKELLAHLLDSEIIFGFRALTYARNDKTNLPMYDHDEYVRISDFDAINSDLLIEHYETARKSNLLLFKSFTDGEWTQVGITGGKNFTTRTIPFIVSGHTNHHIKILRERYL
jgi:hypothetical protein